MLLMTFATKSLSSASAGATRVAVRGFSPIVALVKALIHRREVLRLGELDERGLKDIGLVRSDLDGALAVSWLSDPSVILAERSSARSGVAAMRREAGFQRPVTVLSAAEAQPVVTLRPSGSRPVAKRVEATDSIACSA
ncbi:MAG TPA: DUF1127 domain-containing protein [Bosea sp. (in: a-proteobacteria)]|jgi:uncharacterized protein YjiS (DUF1127 family)|uniref:DUF1127 domain-containing protein n=1 Tax=Bosea sp. (in: a-proteobacteria) TaxID=1871050 RepID=UPI002E11F9C0|nr:DUF1127 domain-containing protein [Bosea sp. (in: a-proteobacteria)]